MFFMFLYVSSQKALNFKNFKQAEHSLISLIVVGSDLGPHRRNYYLLSKMFILAVKKCLFDTDTYMCVYICKYIE